MTRTTATRWLKLARREETGNVVEEQKFPLTAAAWCSSGGCQPSAPPYPGHALPPARHGEEPVCAEPGRCGVGMARRERAGTEQGPSLAARRLVESPAWGLAPSPAAGCRTGKRNRNLCGMGGLRGCFALYEQSKTRVVWEGRRNSSINVVFGSVTLTFSL